MSMRRFRKRRFNRGKKGPKLSGRQKREVKMLMAKQIETKFSNGNILQDPMLGGGTIVNMQQIAQATGASGRIGEQIKVVGFEFKYEVSMGTASAVFHADEYNITRLILFIWHPDSTVDAPTIGSVLIQNGDYVDSIYNTDLKYKYTILYDSTQHLARDYVWNGAAAVPYLGSDSVQVFPSKGVIRLPKKKLPLTQYATGASTYTGKNLIYALYLSDSNYTPHPILTISTVVKYKDA